MIRCPSCGSDLVYSPIPALYFCLERMVGDNITIRTECKPWIAKDAPAEDLLRLTDRIIGLAPELDSSIPSRSLRGTRNEGFRRNLDSPV